MKTATLSMKGHIAQEVTTLARCRKITRKDGTVFAYTSHDQDLVISNDDSPETFTTYKANGIYIPGAIKGDNVLGVPNEEAVGAMLDGDITYEELIAGKFNGALLEEFVVNWADLSMGKVRLPGDKLGAVTPEDNHFKVELRGKIDRLRARTGSVAQPACRVDLFSKECGLNASDFVQSGTVTSTDGKKVMVVSGISNSIHTLITEDLLVRPTMMPWQFTGGINSSYDYGDHSGDAPVKTVTSLKAGDRVSVFFAGGWVKVSDSERPHVDAAGQRDDITGSTTGSTGDYFPTKYIAGSQLGLGGLVFCFADASGNLIPGGIETLGPLDGTVASIVKDTGLLNLNSGFIQAGSVGNTGGGDPHAPSVGTMTPGSPANFHVQGFNAYDNAYWYIKYHNLTEPKYYVHKMKVKLPTTADRSACRAIEWEIQTVKSGLMFNMAWQADFADGGKWRTFDKASHSWQDSGITFDPTIFDGAAWVELESIFSRTDSTVTHVSLKINGTLHTVNITRAAVSTTDHDYTSTAFQLDEDGNTPPTGYDCEVDDWSVQMFTNAGDGLSWSGLVPVDDAVMQFGINDDKLSDNLGDGFNIQVQIDKGIASGTADLTQYNQGGRLTFTSGDNNGYTAEVKAGDTGSSQLVLYLQAPSTIQVGDTFDIWPSCDKQASTCLNKWKNIKNFRAFKYLPGVDAARVTQLIKMP